MQTNAAKHYPSAYNHIYLEKNFQCEVFVAVIKKMQHILFFLLLFENCIVLCPQYTLIEM